MSIISLFLPLPTHFLTCALMRRRANLVLFVLVFSLLALAAGFPFPPLMLVDGEPPFSFLPLSYTVLMTFPSFSRRARCRISPCEGCSIRRRTLCSLPEGSGRRRRHRWHSIRSSDAWRRHVHQPPRCRARAGPVPDCAPVCNFHE